jgi:hypothetical protein
MGVVGTFCQICGVATQHDHYVPMDGMFGIYRGGSGHEVCAPLVAFGPEHAWLKEAVGLRLRADQEPPILEGEIHDGRFEDSDEDDARVWDGIDERAALHKACWELAERPEVWKGARGDETLTSYQQQLFEFGKLVEDGLGWMLADPRSTSPEGRRNAERIRRLLSGR